MPLLFSRPPTDESGTLSDFHLSFVLSCKKGGAMDIDSDVRDAHDSELNEPLETNVADDPEGLSIQNQRLARILEYEEAALARMDPLAAVIGIGNAYFQR